ncbi:transcriptional activator spt7 [Mucor ambiguus]|uniref:Transcriptional activator spt7 n=1 Tax=Mucor ambiguus TaxID=91626 RepID=A0A0C9LZQ0_9FUNG|nr:transcriptional activator spt7 [Mucor ambiguus]
MATSTELPTKLPPWPRLSYALAKHLVHKDVPKTFLTPAEEEHLHTALVSFQQWQHFIELKMDTAAGSECQFTSHQLTAFRVRALLSEQFIPHFFQHNKQEDQQDRPCCQQLKLDIDKLCLEAKQIRDNRETTIAKLEIPRNQLLLNADPGTTTAADTTETEQQQEEEQKHAAQNSDHVPLLDIYHTLEFDMAAMIEQRKLEEYQAQEEVQDEEKSQNNNSNTTLHILDDSDQFNLKYLLKGIADNREKTNLTDRELRNLLLEVKPHKSKWANDDKVGQEDLYEACEKLLTDLKNYTEHSTPFLTKVSKREAPDYYEVIKRPMDLGTVSKKLKAFQYKNKKEFANDLYLIYQNCLDYNTDPHSEYRKHAIAMRRRTDRLLPRVPDIDVKERFGGEEGDDPMDMSEDERASATPAPENGVIPPIKLTLNNNHRERSVSRASRERSITHDSLMDEGFHANYAGKHPKKGTTQPHTAIDTAHEEQSLHHELETDKGELQNTIWREVTKKTRAKVTTDIEKQYQFDFGNRHAITTSSLDIKRFSLMEHLHHRPESTKKLMRCSRTAFTRWLERHEGMGGGVYDNFDLNSEDEDGFDGGFFFSRKSDRPKPTDEDDAVRNDLFLPEYSTVPGLPEIEGVPEEIINTDEYYGDEEEEREDEEHITTVANRKKREIPVLLDQYSATKRPEHGLGALMDDNIRELVSIRSIYKKCNAIRNNTPLGGSNSTVKEDEQEDDDASIPTTTTPIAPSIPFPGSIEISQEATHQMMQRTVIQLLTHAGFEAAQGGPLNVMTDLMAEYFTNIGKTVRAYCDTHNKDMTGEEILLHSLHENGVSQLEDLETYAMDDVEKYGHRLKDVSRRLEGTYQELVAGSTEEAVHDETELFQDDDAFAAGLFGEELGHDFFGFKELGLDQEYSMSSLQVPTKLWFKNDESKLKKMAQDKTKEDPQSKYSVPPPFTPVDSEDAFIGLLKPWYKKRMQDNPQAAAMEDELKPTKKSNRPKYPPIHIRSANASHINSNKRKALRDGSNTLHTTALLEEKKKRKRLLEEAKVQKKKQRLELKAQKLAEKELKKKMREENREKEKLAKQQKEKK